ncbi:Vesicle-trafficking protein SEC22b [Seminavis robusta]|uniref:Vesicle-trafficking protein SEC22b n=1 Tax=Seminavis robusta TaxID=568900 RepID=A0A9N8HEK7_9STRA|nr:Vesicle-trafficking protein SEC22b [Seminavis robusta]|eukprot:Sro411_g137670.1 Vesicle-trafficking protein SEC22b (216) ;mRNA; f:36583-37334
MDGLPLVSSQSPSPGMPVTNKHQQEAKEIIRKMTVGGAPTRMSVDSGDRAFSFMTRDNLCFLVLTEAPYPKRLAFLYLEDIADLILGELAREFGNEWRSQIDQTARPFRFIQYDPLIQRKQRDYRDVNQQKSRLNEDLTEIQSIMRKNINEILDRGEKLDQVSSISNELKQKSKDFKWGAKKLTWQARLQQYGPMLVGTSIVLIVLYVKIFHIGF